LLSAGWIVLAIAGYVPRPEVLAPAHWPTWAAACFLAAALIAIYQLIRDHWLNIRLRVEVGEHEAAINPRFGAKPVAKTLQQAVRSLMEATEQALFDAAAKVREMETQLKVAHAERQHAEAIIYSISDAVLVTDPRDELVLANESAARTFEFDLGHSEHLPMDKVLHDPRMIALIREMRQCKSASGRRIVEHRIQTHAGERTFRITLSCVAEESASPAGVVAVLHDVTSEKEVNEMKNEFVSMVSHELRTPLASIKAYIEMLLDGEAENAKTQREFYEVIQNEANRLGRLIDNILNISRIESGLVRVNLQPQSLDLVFADALEVILPQTRQKNISIIQNLAAPDAHTLADRDMLYQAVLNLLSNAVKYTPGGGSITVTTEIDPDRKKVLAKIIDTGVGIPPKDLPFVFDKFYRAEANNRIAPGTGLGLSLVRHIVETVHHGRIFVQSQVAKGSCFGFEMDLIENDQSPARQLLSVASAAN
jgi:two-component system phosphate regulon sensor histidine kinase PhoR